MIQNQQKPFEFEPLAVTKRQAFTLINAPKLVQRMLYWTRNGTLPSHKWLVIIREGGRGTETLIDYASFKAAYERLRSGEVPPPMPSEGGTK